MTTIIMYNMFMNQILNLNKMKEINLEEILLLKIPKDCYWEDMGNLTNCPKEYVLSAMKEACNQCLNTAAENAVGKVDLIYGENLEYPSCEEVAVIDKDSILQIKDWIK
jgi:hypothetical protein